MRYMIDDFHAKLCIILHIVGKNVFPERLKAKGISAPKPGIKSWLTGTIPHDETIDKIMDVAGISIETLKKDLLDFIEDIYSFKKIGERTLAYTRDSNASRLPEYEQNYQGYYYCWFNWLNINEPQKNIYKTLVKVEKINKFSKTITSYMTTYRYINSRDHHDPLWGFKGSLSPIEKSSIFLAFENINNVTKKTGYTTLHVSTLNEKPDDGLWGIYSAEPSLQNNYAPLPTSTRLFLKRVEKLKSLKDEEETENKLIESLGWFHPNEVAEEVNIDRLQNAIHPSYGVLSLFSL